MLVGNLQYKIRWFGNKIRKKFLSPVYNSTSIKSQFTFESLFETFRKKSFKKQNQNNNRLYWITFVFSECINTGEIVKDGACVCANTGETVQNGACACPANQIV